MQHHISDFIGTSVVLIANLLTCGCIFWDLVDFINRFFLYTLLDAIKYGNDLSPHPKLRCFEFEKHHMPRPN